MNEEKLELKHYVFAMYIGQKVMKWHNPQPAEDAEFTETVTGSMLEAYAHECYLNLKLISAISDSEAIEVAKMWGSVHMVENGKSLIEYWHTGLLDAKDAVAMYQYLQQNGFALPIFHKGIHYTVEKLGELGIYKLTN